MMVKSRKRLLTISLLQQNSSETNILLPFIDCHGDERIQIFYECLFDSEI